VDVDPIDAHLDPFDQGSEDRTPSRGRQLGPLPPDLRGGRDKLLLRRGIWEPRRDCPAFSPLVAPFDCFAALLRCELREKGTLKYRESCAVCASGAGA